VARFDLATRPGRVHAVLRYLWDDHAYLRLGFQNAHWVSETLVRANQPWPFQLRWWKARGVRSVINLRGGGYETAAYVLERQACRDLGLNLVDFAMSSREAPRLDQVEDAVRIFDTTEYPALVHCKSGADRAGIFCVLYAHYKLGKPLRQAMEELSFRTLHVKHGKVGVLDYTFERYFQDGEPRGLSFFDWVKEPGYDPKAIKADFHTSWWGTLITERLLRRE